MAVQLDKRKEELIHRLIRYRKGKVSGSKGQLFEAFMIQYLTHISPSDLEWLSIPEIYNLIREHWAFAFKRRAGTSSVRVYNPIKKTHGYYTGHSVIEICTDDMPFLVDSVKATIDRFDLKILFIIHPIIFVGRNTNGNMVEVRAPEEQVERAPGANQFNH